MQLTSISPAIKHGLYLLAQNAVLPHLPHVPERYMQVVKPEFSGWLPAWGTHGHC